MGCSNHFILQKKQQDGVSWKTIDVDVFYMCSSNARSFNAYTENIRTPGIPEDIPKSQIKQETGEWGGSSTYIDGYDMGEHSLGYATIKELLEGREALEKTPRVSFEQADGEIHIFVQSRDDCFGDGFPPVFLDALGLLYGIDADQYRLIMGYSS